MASSVSHVDTAVACHARPSMRTATPQTTVSASFVEIGVMVPA